MRIGLIAPPWLPVPPPAYGGTELVVDYLARGLAELGHDVRLFTVGESRCPVRRLSVFDECAAPMGFGAAEAAHVLAAYDELVDVDVVHDHTLLGPLVAPDHHPPIVMTNHGPFYDVSHRLLRAAAARATIVAISRAHAARAGDVRVDAVVHHGIDVELHHPSPHHDDTLLFIGRMSPDKGLDRAIRIARLTGRPLVAVAKMRAESERAYFADVIRPLLGADVTVLDEPPLDTKLRLLRHSAALVNPIAWPEPFGLVMVEALASGTPVLAFPRGAAPEIVTEGRTGFLRDTVEDLAATVARLHEIDRGVCRATAVRRFSRQRMTDLYLAVYRRAMWTRSALHRTSVTPRRPVRLPTVG